MKYAILSDIHANFEALTLVMSVAQQLGVEHYIILGDLVGYNANPAECVHLIRSLENCTVIKGNHDHYVSNGDNLMEGFNEHAKQAVFWTREQLTPDDINWLRDLPMTASFRQDGIVAVHATLDSPSAWGYVFDVHHAKDCFSYQRQMICFCGHSHAPLAFVKPPSFLSNGQRGGGVSELPQWAWIEGESLPPTNLDIAEMIEIQLEPKHHYLVNVGSVGQPRNRDPRASFAFYDTSTGLLSRLRIPYDIALTQEKIINAGLPTHLALRLGTGC